MTDVPSYREHLLTEFHNRTQRNPRYSLRAFAAYLDIDPSALCRIFSGRQEPSSGTSLKLALKLGLSPEEQLVFLRSAIDERAKKEFVRWSQRAEQPSRSQAPDAPLVDHEERIERVA